MVPAPRVGVHNNGNHVVFLLFKLYGRRSLFLIFLWLDLPKGQVIAVNFMAKEISLKMKPLFRDRNTRLYQATIQNVLLRQTTREKIWVGFRKREIE